MCKIRPTVNTAQLIIQCSNLWPMFKVLVDGCVHDVHWSTSGLPVKAKALCVRLHHLLPNPGGIPLGCDYLPPGTKQTKERNLRGKPHFAHRRTHLGMRQCLWPGKKNYLSIYLLICESFIWDKWGDRLAQMAIPTTGTLVPLFMRPKGKGFTSSFFIRAIPLELEVKGKMRESQTKGNRSLN